MLTNITTWLVSIMLAATTAAQAPSEQHEAEIGKSLTSVSYSLEDAPTCWEDEVVVVVVHDPYGTSPGEGTLGCVPADDLPVNGYRP